MRQLKARLKNSLKGAKRIAFLGVGSELHGDDAAGMLVARQIKDFPSRKKIKAKVEVFLGHTAPENLTGQIKKFKPTHMIILDAADVGAKAGKIIIFDPQDEAQVCMSSTHRLPLRILADYLKTSVGCQTLIIGIQPKIIGFGQDACLQVRRAAQKVAESIKALLSKY
ncbi:MAG: hydrogenase 3 maturation endopeptidase HyCI [Candidatus Omnitrophica bacterium]|nr:hydrogenase 3 maturation endopeptidase HyCI [Candidatus Omnitrophota bacterium]